jgi:putative Ca2+/H+ antiporter (TMEM165/GDT1 family)
MKSKQLANVLIKVLGLSLCVQSANHCVTGIFNLLASRMPFPLINFVAAAILAAVGIYFIVRSQNVAGCLFRGEDE